MEVNKTQQIQFELMKANSFNAFDGNQVVSDLLLNRDLWRGVIMDRDDLVKLRDIEEDCWNVDTLYIYSSGVDDKKLKSIVSLWHADEYGFMENNDASLQLGTSHPKGRILEIWWD